MLQEHKHLHEDIINRLERQAKIEVYTIFSCAVVYGFIATKQVNQDVKVLFNFVWWVPFAVSILGFVKWYGIHRVIVIMSAYIKECYEDPLREKGSLFHGWVNYFLKRKGRVNHTMVMWSMLITATLSVAVLQTVVAPSWLKIGGS